MRNNRLTSATAGCDSPPSRRRRIPDMRLPDLRKWLARSRRTLEAAELSAWPEAEPALQAEEEQAAAPVAPDSAWTPQRIALADLLWGEGCLWPGGTEEVLRVAAPLGLTAASSLLLLGAGSAGPALRLAGEFGVWVCACEADPVLAAVAARRVQRAGVALAKRATMQSWDPAAPSFRQDAFHHALAIEALRGPRPAAIVTAMGRAVRPGGQIAIVETVAPSPLDPADPAVAGWCRMEGRAPPLPGTAWVTKPLADLGFDLRVTEDVTARHVRLAVGGWKRLVRAMKQERPPPLRAAATLAEAEFWLRRIHLLRSGRLRVMRWLAVGGGDTQEGRAP
jgi:hypothetical protein